MQNLFVPAVLFALPMLVGCGSHASLPGDHEGEEAVKGMRSPSRDDLWSQMKLVSFHKTKGETNGDNAYRMEGEFDAELTVDGWWDARSKSVITNNKERQKLRQDCPVVKIGQRLKGVPTTIDFEKTQKGWRRTAVDLDWGKVDQQLKAH